MGSCTGYFHTLRLFCSTHGRLLLSLDLCWWVYWSKAPYSRGSTLGDLTQLGTLLTVWLGARPGRERSQLLMLRLWRPCADRMEPPSPGNQAAAAIPQIW